MTTRGGWNFSIFLRGGTSFWRETSCMDKWQGAWLAMVVVEDDMLADQ